MKTILLAEDDPFTIDIYTTKFRAAGFEVDVATNGKEVLKKLKEKNSPTTLQDEKKIWPDFLVLDIVLPQIDGFEILRKIKDEKNLKNLKVIILSNLGQKGEVEKGLKLGAIKYLIKAHYTPTEVVEEIKEILK